MKLLQSQRWNVFTVPASSTIVWLTRKRSGVMKVSLCLDGEDLTKSDLYLLATKGIIFPIVQGEYSFASAHRDLPFQLPLSGHRFFKDASNGFRSGEEVHGLVVRSDSEGEDHSIALFARLCDSHLTLVQSESYDVAELGSPIECLVFFQGPNKKAARRLEDVTISEASTVRVKFDQLEGRPGWFFWN